MADDILSSNFPALDNTTECRLQYPSPIGRMARRHVDRRDYSACNVHHLIEQDAESAISGWSSKTFLCPVCFVH